MVDIDLRKECFSYEKLYVAISRVASPENQYVLLSPTYTTTNIVYNKALR